MFSRDQYELIDFGDRKKLEFFAGKRVCRPCPLANQNRRFVDEWKDCLTFVPDDQSAEASRRGHWSNWDGDERWNLEWKKSRFHLRPTPFGHLGVFPEQVENWHWILEQKNDLAGLKAINLFAYTGGTTMALAQRGVKVTHVDSARNIVNWARQNASLAGMKDSPVRWIVDDVTRFVDREVRRKRHYDIIVLDPPSFGRGPKNELWKIQKHLEPLLENLSILVRENCVGVLLSCHTPEFDRRSLAKLLTTHFGLAGVEGLPMKLDKKLTMGDCARWFQD